MNDEYPENETTYLLNENGERNVHREYKRRNPNNECEESKYISVGCILMAVLCERMAYYSVVANMILFCTTTLRMESSEAATVNLIFTGSVFILPIFGGYIADAHLGKYNTILASGFINILGLFMLLASALDYTALVGNADKISDKTRITFFTISLILITIGTGGVKANIGPFGAEQVQCYGPNAVQSFYNWFYWMINIGAVIAHSGVAYAQQNMGFTRGFIMPLAVMLLSQLFFLAGKKRYTTTQTDDRSVLCEAVCIYWPLKCKGLKKNNRASYSQESVDRIVPLIRILPVFGFCIVYWAVYSQMNTTYYIQGQRLNLLVGSHQVPVAILVSFNIICVLILIPVMDRIVYPFLAIVNKSPTYLQKMGIGMVFSTLSVLVAGIVEVYRKRDLFVQQTISSLQYNASSLSVLVQIPQFALIGTSEVFTSIGGLEFAYYEAPSLMQGVCMGLFLETQGLGTYLSVIILSIVLRITGTEPPNSWFPDDINKGKVENLFFLFAILMAVNFVMFIIVAHYYKYRLDISKTEVQTSAIDSPVKN